MKLSNILFSFLFCVFGALIISPIIFWGLKRLKSGQNILEYVDNHKSKQGTLSMGGLIFVIATFFSIIFFDGSKMLAMLCIVIACCYALVGFLDDFLKVRHKHNEGLKPYQKIIGQVGIAIIVAIFIYNFGMTGNEIFVPFTNIKIGLGWWIIPFVIVFFIAVTNSVNLTDGLDGLAGFCSFVIIITLGIVSLTKYNNVVDMGMLDNLSKEYFNISIVCFGFAGALLVFLLFNSYPAKIFMGDTGSLAIGGFVASVSAFLQEYLLIAIVGVVFVVSAVSDILQVGYYKMTKNRIFLMAPFHHHLERKGLHENKIVTIYTFVTIMVCFVTIFVYLTK